MAFCGLFCPKLWQKVAKSGKKIGKNRHFFGQKVANFVPNGRIIKRQLFWRFLGVFVPPPWGVPGGVTPQGTPIGGPKVVKNGGFWTVYTLCEKQ